MKTLTSNIVGDECLRLWFYDFFHLPPLFSLCLSLDAALFCLVARWLLTWTSPPVPKRQSHLPQSAPTSGQAGGCTPALSPSPLLPPSFQFLRHRLWISDCISVIFVLTRQKVRNFNTLKNLLKSLKCFHSQTSLFLCVIPKPHLLILLLEEFPSASVCLEMSLFSFFNPFPLNAKL